MHIFECANSPVFKNNVFVKSTLYFDFKDKLKVASFPESMLKIKAMLGWTVFLVLLTLGVNT